MRKRHAPIDDSNLTEYINEKYPELIVTSKEEIMLENFSMLRQADFGEKLNCSLTSVTASIFHAIKGNEEASSVGDIYAYVRKVARLFLYTPRLIGTISLFVGPIYGLSARHFGISAGFGYGVFKGFGYRLETIKRQIRKGKPVVLSLFRDGVGIYRNHTVTVTGVKTFYSKTAGKNISFLVINDNWSDRPRYLDFNKLWIISSINY